MRYIRAWYNMDKEGLIDATRLDCRFDDPAEPDPVSRDSLSDYMLRWHHPAPSKHDWVPEQELRQNMRSILIG